MKRTFRILAASILIASNSVYSQEAVKSDPRQAVQGERPDKGWFFYEDPVKEKPEAKPEENKKKAVELKKPPKQEKDKSHCDSNATWKVDCGFKDPGMDMKFQEKMRDELLNNMSLSKNDANAVKQFQLYMKWLMSRATEVANQWYFNQVQDPTLDPSVTQPISQFGLRLMTQVKGNSKKEFFSQIKEDSVILYFSRQSCDACTYMRKVIEQVSIDTGLEVVNIPLDGKCMPGFESKCEKRPQVEDVARKLSIDVVPTLVIYSKPDSFIKISTGVAVVDEIVERAYQFLKAYQNALVKGLKSNVEGQAAADFSNNSKETGNAKAIENKSIDKEVKDLINK